MSKELTEDQEFIELLENKEDGSLTILKQYLEMVLRIKPDKVEMQLMNKRLLNSFPDMAILKNGLDNVGNDFNKSQKLIEALDSQNKVISRNLSNKIGQHNRILTFSNSSTVAFCLNQLQDIEIWVMESLPGGEGKNMQIHLKHITHLISDKVGYELIEKKRIEILVLGCDSFIEGVGFVNKVGSQYLVDLCLVANTPVLILGSRLKSTGLIAQTSSNLMEHCTFNSVTTLILDT
ncbi:MAG: hypothetical protein IH840_06390 [Candidatus Heimdallarchaeota archaeon]|nr:hypothetical protein [Candidatus Heimdallarchaeota archaeon]